MNKLGITAVICLLGALLIMYIIQIQVTSNLSVLNDQYATLQVQINAITKANEQIKDEVLSESSLTVISQKAQTLGFIPGTRVMYMGK